MATVTLGSVAGSPLFSFFSRTMGLNRIFLFVWGNCSVEFDPCQSTAFVQAIYIEDYSVRIQGNY